MHHGSATSTSESFLGAVDPAAAVIFCAAGNGYGHPHESVTERLEARGTQVFRTDIHGDVVFRSDGNNLTVSIK